MSRSPFEDLVHRVNNLLSTIEIQGAVAEAEGTLAAYVAALAQITASARRTQEEMAVLRAASRRERASDGDA